MTGVFNVLLHKLLSSFLSCSPVGCLAEGGALDFLPSALQPGGAHDRRRFPAGSKVQFKP